MMPCMSKTLPALILAISFISVSAPTSAEPNANGKSDHLVFSAGRQGSAYWGVANRFQQVLAGNSIAVDVLESKGSLENLERLDSNTSKVNITLTQADALNEYLQAHPALNERLVNLESIGLECVFLITSTNSGVANEADLAKAKGFKIALPGAESGVAVTYRNLVKLDPDFAKTEAVYLDAAKAMEALGKKGDGGVDALMVVLRPKERTPEIQQAIDQPNLYQFVEFLQTSLETKLPSGHSIYSFLDMPLVRKKANVERSLPTVCVNGLLVGAKDKMPEDAKRSLERILDEQWMRIYSKDF